MEANTPKRSTPLSIALTVLIVIVGLVVVFYLWKFLYSGTMLQSTTLLSGDKQATVELKNLPSPPGLYEGGEYTISTWVYVNSYNVNRNSRKHILQIGGDNFSTLLIALGAFKNNLVVRVHSKDSETGYTVTDSTGNSRPATTTYSTPNSQREGAQGSLAKKDLDKMFSQLAMDDSLIEDAPMCDLPEIDLQRWVNITVVLSGRVTDVYLDGKLARSCINHSYYKVDPAGVSAKMAAYGGFDGFIGTTKAYNYSLTPSDIYNIYRDGPKGGQGDIIGWISSFFKK